MCKACDWSNAVSRHLAKTQSERQPVGDPSRRRALDAGAAIATALVASSLASAAPAFARESGSPAAGVFTPNDGEADWLFENGSIYTVDPSKPTAQAVAVRGQQIVYVGDRAGAAKWNGRKTRTVDLTGRMLLPGFIDAHNHLASLAVSKLGVNIRGLTGKDAIVDAIREWVADQPPGAPLRGHGWISPGSFGADSPRREWLDEITGDRPMYILTVDGHEMWYNSAAIKAAGITAKTPDPDPGKQYYVRDADGTPSGHSIEVAAIIPICAALGIFSPASIRDSQKLTIDRAPSWGMTTYMDAGIVVGAANASAEPVWNDLIARDNAGTLPIRIVGTVWTRENSDDPTAIITTLADWNQRLRSPHVHISICKMWVEGSWPAGGALLLEPFADEPASRGQMTLTAEHIAAQIEAAQVGGFDMHMHADADGSVRIILDAIEAMQKRLGRQDRRHTICHLSTTHPDDVPRFKALGVIANGTSLWGTDYDGVAIDLYTKRLGKERYEAEMLPYGDICRSGATVTFGADLPGVDIDECPPLVQLEAAVTRKRPGFPNDRTMVARQALTLAQAVQAFTINGAFQLRMEHAIGSIEVGKLADLVVLGKNLFDVNPEAIHDVPVLLTLMDGLARHDALAAPVSG